MDKQVLIFFPHRLKQRHGGPYSMLFHLQAGLNDRQHEVRFLSTLFDFEGEEPAPERAKTSFLKKVVKPFVPEALRIRRRIGQWIREVNQPDSRILQQLDLSRYAIVHFHETIDVWRYRQLLEGYKGKIVLTSHSPRPYHQELVFDALQLTREGVGENVYRQLENIDRFAYEKADHLLFPCPEAVEPYRETWPYFRKPETQGKLAYVTTGVIPSGMEIPGPEVRKNLGVPDGAFVVSFVGRQIPVKGYDLLVQAAQAILEEREDVYFIVVGKKGEQPGFSHPRFITTGWTNDPFSFVAAANLHVVPNRFTNFDLNVLEVMSLGKPILLSLSGGNKYFQKFAPTGLFYHEPTAAGLLQQLKACYGMRHRLKEMGKTNQGLYQDHFTAERFAGDQLQFYNAIAHDE